MFIRLCGVSVCQRICANPDADVVDIVDSFEGTGEPLVCRVKLSISESFNVILPLSSTMFSCYPSAFADLVFFLVR